jgi:hypothetical protein
MSRCSRETLPRNSDSFLSHPQLPLDHAQQLEHTEDRYEVIREGEIMESEHYSRSPAGRWYTPAQAIELYEDAGFTTIRILKEFTHEQASPSDPVAQNAVFSVLGERP